MPPGTIFLIFPLIYLLLLSFEQGDHPCPDLKLLVHPLCLLSA